MPESVEITVPPLTVSFDARLHAYTFHDARTNRVWSAAAAPGAFEVTGLTRHDTSFLVNFKDTNSGLGYRCRVDVAPDAVVTFAIASDSPSSEFTELAYPPRPQTQLERGMMLFCNRAGGNYVPLNDPRFSRSRLTVYANTDALDMPWFGVVDDQVGDGLMVLFETPCEAAVVLQPDQDENAWPQPAWFNSFGTFSYDRRMSFRFSSEGGYVALAAMFRTWAEGQGLIKTLAEKAGERPRVEWLKGAIVVWGSDGLRFARQARAAGVSRCLINGQYPARDMTAMTRDGFLVGHYDNYSDIVDGDLGMTRDAVEEVAFRDPDGSPRKGWLAKDGKQYYMRATSQALKAAQVLIPQVLEEHPYTARFLDVHSALQLFEDYNPNRRDDRRADLQYRRDLYRYVASLGLVVGGEHGKSWCVPELDYAEGPMSGPFWWHMDVGHLLPLKSRDDIHPDYLRYGINPVVRIPLWELVYHDCMVTTWYWGDSSGYLYNIAPEMSDTKDLLNLLYGTVPLVWTNHLCYGWDRHRDRLLQTYYTTCRLHEEKSAFSKLVKHEFISADRLMQRTTFDSGLVVTVNFSDEPRPVSAADGQGIVLAPKGFVAEAVGIEFVREWKDHAAATRIALRDFFYAEGAPGKPTSCGPLEVEGRAAMFKVGTQWQVRLDPRTVAKVDVSRIPNLPMSGMTRIALLDDDGRLVDEVTGEAASFVFNADDKAVLYALLAGMSEVDPLILPSGGEVGPGDRIRLATRQKDVSVHYTLDGTEPTPEALLYTQPFTLNRGAIVKARAFVNGKPVGTPAAATFEVSAVLASSGVLRGGDPAVDLSVDLTGYDQLQIKVTNAGDGSDYDQALLGEPVLVSKDKTEVFLGDLMPSAATQTSARLKVNRESDPPMTVAGVAYPRSVWLHAEASVTYEVNGQFERLSMVAGVPDATNPERDPKVKKGSVEFVVTGVSKAPAPKPSES